MITTPDAVLDVVWAIWLASWIVAAVWRGKTEARAAPRNETTYRLLTAAGALLLFGAHPRAWSMDARLWRLRPAAAWVMVTVAACGLLFTWWARITLGRLWSSGVVRRTDHHVVERGPYRFVRHPIYTGIILATLATALVRGTAVACAGAALIAAGLYIKARIEEGFLRQQLGEGIYAAYARRVPMIVPFLRVS